MPQFSKAILHNEFRNGAAVGDFATDWQQLSTAEQLVVATFISRLSQPDDLPGYNKDSWSDGRTGKELAGSEYYKRAGAWHYHSGPYHTQGTVGTPPHLPTNVEGSRSREAIHYFKISQTTLIVFGYSRLHVPFLNSLQFPRMKGHPFYAAMARKLDAS